MDEVAKNPAGAIAEITHYFARGWKVKIWTFQVGKAVTYSRPTGVRRLVWHDNCVQKPPGEDTFEAGASAAGPSQSFGFTARWCDTLECDGLPAKERAEWLCKEKGFDMSSAQQIVMSENPAVFRFRPDVVCDGSKASERADWLMSNQGMSKTDARRKVMTEFPSCDWWSPGLMCDNIVASERAKWLMENNEMTNDQAIEHLLHESPHVFRYDPQADLDGVRAQDRLDWLLSNNDACKGNTDAAIRTLLREFPWHDDLYCDGIRAAERAQWLVSNNGMSLADARKKVMEENPAAFAA
jgi:hypothetical protein